MLDGTALAKLVVAMKAWPLVGRTRVVRNADGCGLAGTFGRAGEDLSGWIVREFVERDDLRLGCLPFGFAAPKEKLPSGGHGRSEL